MRFAPDMNFRCLHVVHCTHISLKRVYLQISRQIKHNHSSLSDELWSSLNICFFTPWTLISCNLHSFIISWACVHGLFSTSLVLSSSMPVRMQLVFLFYVHALLNFDTNLLSEKNGSLRQGKPNSLVDQLYWSVLWFYWWMLLKLNLQQYDKEMIQKICVCSVSFSDS